MKSTLRWNPTFKFDNRELPWFTSDFKQWNLSYFIRDSNCCSMSSGSSCRYHSSHMVSYSCYMALLIRRKVCGRLWWILLQVLLQEAHDHVTLAFWKVAYLLVYCLMELSWRLSHPKVGQLDLHEGMVVEEVIQLVTFSPQLEWVAMVLLELLVTILIQVSLVQVWEEMVHHNHWMGSLT